MSEENVEVMRRLMRATAAGDYEASVRYLAPDIEIDDTDIPESTGTDSFREWIELTREDAVLGEFRGGKIVKVGYYNDQQQALDAAGLRE
jgi:hypothetical protein